ncbi:hypothetical protein HT585_23430 [Ensifer sp. HO-A22]|uniref:Uncharacterized protein n=1 Tax=Ensifer oleiphilus TaxID=2742698 RepID=A0A7Y6QA28_9HYPH|nr:hypothetical protein [Ensifer oleiphilus]
MWSAGSPRCTQLGDLAIEVEFARSELLRATKALDNLAFANDEQRVAIDIVPRAVEAPVRQIAETAGGQGSMLVWQTSGKV